MLSAVNIDVRKPSVVVIANYCIEYNVLFNGKCIINLVPLFCFAKNVTFLWGVHNFSFTGYVNIIHEVFHSSDAVSIVY